MNKQTKMILLLWTAYIGYLVMLKLNDKWYGQKIDFFWIAIVLVIIIMINYVTTEHFIKKHKELTDEAINIAVQIAKKKEEAR